MPPLGGGDGSPGSVARATYAVEVAWTSDVVGLFTIGVSTIAGGDVLGTGLYDPSFTGPYDDVTAMLDRVTITRGRDDRLSFVQAGEATITLRDSDGMLNDRNPSSPLAGMLDDRLHPVRVVSRRDLYPGFESHFFGFVRRIVWQPNGRRGIAQLECVDAFYWLERTFPIIASMGPTTTGAAISAILDAASFPTSWRILDVGDAIPDFSADGSQDALTLIAGLLEAERGVFYIAKAGEGRFESRHSRQLRRTVGAHATIQNDLHEAEPAVDFGLVKNRVRVRRTQNDYVAEAFDAVSRDKIGWSDLPEIATPYMASDSQADSLSGWLLKQVVQPRPPTYAMSVDNRTAALLDFIHFAELVDRIRVVALQGDPARNMDDEFFIERLSHSIEFGRRYRHSLQATLSLASGALAPFTIGYSQLAASTRRNLVPNPSFERDIVSGGWLAVDNGAPSLDPVRFLDPAHSFSGDSCLSFTETVSGADDYFELDIPGLEPGTVYTISAYVDAYGFLAAANLNRGLYAWDTANILTAQTATLTAATIGYQRLSVQVTTTPTLSPSHTIRLRLYAPQGQVRWDAVMVEEGSTLGSYFDGDTPGAAWEGTAHNSISSLAFAGDVLVY